MSGEYKLDYFPPKGTKYLWASPPLQHGSWTLNIKTIVWPQSCFCSVDRNDKGYIGQVSFYPITRNRFRTIKKTRFFKNPLKALLATEKIADGLLEKDTKPWMREALAAGWRP